MQAALTLPCGSALLQPYLWFGLRLCGRKTALAERSAGAVYC
jgi:hypothetical protein